ncbi:TRIM7 ligase, partial [Bucco capensis]|nr:TRIM7 ligase [Bucco capensis]
LTLDQRTANDMLCLSEDLKVMWHKPCLFGLRLNSSSVGHFTVPPFVLASEGFTSGQHCWEVEICQQDWWYIGMAKESVLRKMPGSFQWQARIWALCYAQGQYKGTSPFATIPLTLPKLLQRVRVFLDYEEEKLMFFDAVSKTKVFDFSKVSFQGEKVYPWFSVC